MPANVGPPPAAVVFDSYGSLLDVHVAVPRDAAMAAKTAPILIKAGAIAPACRRAICASAPTTRWRWMAI